MRTLTDTTFSDEVIDTAFALLVAGIPVLHSAVLHFRILQGNNLHDGCVQLVLVALRGRAALHIAHVGLFVGNDECALKLACAAGIDAEITRQLDGAAHPLGNIAERPIAEHGRVQGGKEIVAARHHRTQILLHQVGVLLHSLADGAEQDAFLLQHLLRRRLHRHRVHDGVVCHPCQLLLLPQGNAQLVEGGQQFRIHLVEAFLLLLLLGGCVVYDVLIVHLVILQVSPCGFLHSLPAAEGFQPELQQPFGLILFFRYEAYHILIQTLADGVGLDICDKAPFIFFAGNFLYDTIVIFCHCNDSSFCLPCKGTIFFLIARLY